jgi:hypothetical protein
MVALRFLTARSVVGTLMFLVPLTAGAAELDEHLAALKPYVGKTWKGEFAESTAEKPLFDVARWEVALKGKAVRVLHSVNDGVYGGETIITWDGAKQALVYFYFTTAGFYTQGTMEVKADKLVSRETVTGNANGITEVEATTELQPDGRMRTSARYLKGGEWAGGREVTYREAPDAKVNLD